MTTAIYDTKGATLKGIRRQTVIVWAMSTGRARA